jgi:hypothetical protein
VAYLQGFCFHGPIIASARRFSPTPKLLAADAMLMQMVLRRQDPR